MTEHKRSAETNPRIPTNERKQLIWMAYFYLRDKKGGLIPTDAEIGALIGYHSRGNVAMLIKQMISEQWFKPREHKFRTLLPLRMQTEAYAELSDIAKGIWQDVIQQG